MTATKPTFLNERYGAYLHSDIPKEDEEMTHVGPGTPCGEYFRRFWQPVAILEDLKDLPKAIKIMNEELVIFRDRSGKVGLLELHCSHRGTSLEFGLIEEQGIRCCYHGWLFGVDGRILDTPGEPPDSTYKERLCHGAYPVHVYQGMVFAYMGPPDKMPPFPIFDTYEAPGYYLLAKKNVTWPANWLQHIDNCIDPIHTAYLHTRNSGAQFEKEFEEVGELDFMETPLGVIYINTRRVGDNAWVRSSEHIPPNMHQLPALDENGRQERPFTRPSLIEWFVPVDDAHTLDLGFDRIKEGDEPQDLYAGQGGEHRTYEERQRQPLDYDAQTSQRPIVVHALEHLANSDRGIIMLREIARRGIRAVQKGQDPKALALMRAAGGPIATYCGNTVLRVPPAPTPEEDSRLLMETGRGVSEDHVKNPPTLAMLG